MINNKKFLFVAALVLIGLSVLCACSGKTDVESDKELAQVELITKENRHLIGKEYQGTVRKLSEDELSEFNEELSQKEYSLPENNIVKEVADGQNIPVHSLVELEVSDNKTPEVIIPNGCMGVFSQENEKGWECKKGDIIEWSFEKYPLLESNANQSLTIGYIRNGSMNEGESYQDLNGSYSLTASEDGMYYIYFIGTSSDPISMKEGHIQLKHN